MKDLMTNDKMTTMSSREIAKLTGKRHDHVLRDCDKLNEHYKNLSLTHIGGGDKDEEEEYDRSKRTQYKYIKNETIQKVCDHFGIKNYPLIQESYYTHPNTGVQQHREYQLTKIQTLDLMTGYRIDLRIKVNRRWEELENKEKKQQYKIPESYSEALRLAAAQAEQLELQEQQLKEQEPKVTFAESVSGSSNSILVRQFAKDLCDDSFEIGQNRLFDWFRKHNYLNHKNEPYQNYIDMQLFEVITRTIGSGEETFTTKTTKITGKGQIYFANKIKKL